MPTKDSGKTETSEQERTPWADIADALNAIEAEVLEDDEPVRLLNRISVLGEAAFMLPMQLQAIENEARGQLKKVYDKDPTGSRAKIEKALGNPQSQADGSVDEILEAFGLTGTGSLSGGDSFKPFQV